MESAFDDLAQQRIDELLDGLSFRSPVEQNVAALVLAYLAAFAVMPDR